jgi:PAS domain S-box-containing protein
MVTREPSNLTDASATQRPEDLGIGQLFWTMRDAVVVGDATTGTVVLWNPAAERLFGWSAAAIIGAPIERLVPDRLRAAHRAGLGTFALTGHGPLIDSGLPIEVPALRQEGTEITVELTMTPLSDTAGDGGARYIVAFARDATARTHLARERATVLAAAQQYAARLAELATLKAHFTAMVAHEFGAPVAAIRGLVDLLARGAIAAGDQPAVLGTMRAEIDLISRLVRDVETAAAVERDDFTVHPRPVPVAAVLADAAGYARLLPGDHPFEEAVDEGVMVVQVLADPERLGQVVRNLLGNAAKHTPPGTPITLHAHREGDRVRIAVADEGPGIAPEDRMRIIQKFGRGRDAERHHTPGAGLGLYVARCILGAHDTRLEIDSASGRGARFSFTLDIVP